MEKKPDPKERVELKLEVPKAPGKTKELPFVLTIADSFDGQAQHPDYSTATLIEIEKSGNCAEAFETIKPQVKVGDWKLVFRKFADFNPEKIIQAIPELKQLLDEIENVTRIKSRLTLKPKLLGEVKAQATEVLNKK